MIGEMIRLGFGAFSTVSLVISNEDRSHLTAAIV